MALPKLSDESRKEINLHQADLRELIRQKLSEYNLELFPFSDQIVRCSWKDANMDRLAEIGSVCVLEVFDKQLSVYEREFGALPAPALQAIADSARANLKFFFSNPFPFQIRDDELNPDHPLLDNPVFAAAVIKALRERTVKIPPIEGTGEIQSVVITSQGEGTVGSTGLRATVDQFIERVWGDTGVRIKRGDIPLVAGYEDPSQFQRVQRGKRVTQAAQRVFQDVLGLDSREFLRRLEVIKARKAKAAPGR
jgi:hypothetical protein